MCNDNFARQPHPTLIEESTDSLPFSPNSLTHDDLFVEHHDEASISHLRGGSVVAASTLHLQPVTWDSVKEINFPEGELFEIVDGLLVWVPMAHGTKLHQQILTALVLLVVQLRQWYATSNVDLEVASLNDSTKKLLKSGDSDVNRRGPDVVVLRDHSPSSESSSDSNDTSRKEKCVLRTKNRPPYAVIEVTSESTRTVDITSKWIQYALTGIPFYYIVDLNYYESSGEACVIAGSLHPFDDAARCINGSPKTPPSSWQAPDVHHHELYYKKVYRGEDRVKAGIFKDVSMTAKQFMDPVHIKGLFRSLKHGERMRSNPYPNRKNSASPHQLEAHDETNSSKEGSSPRASKIEENQTQSSKRRTSTTSSKAYKRTDTITDPLFPSGSGLSSPDKKRSKRDSQVRPVPPRT